VDFSFTQDQRQLIERINHLVKERIAPRAAQYDTAFEAPVEDIRDLYDQGWLLANLGKRRGGLGFGLYGDDPLAFFLIDEHLAYGNPSTASVAQKLVDQGCERILTFPLYPQYSATTTATANDQLFRALMKMRRAPAIRSVPPYYDEPVYIEALARSIEKHLATLDFLPEVVITSYHGIPKPYSDKGDPYRSHCLETTRLLRTRLGWDENKLITTFQSRFGAQEWLQPYTDVTVEKLAKDGVKSIAIVNPGFSVDCIETLDEIGREAAETFHHAGGKNFAHIPCLNDSAEGMAVVEALARRELSGWV